MTIGGQSLGGVTTSGVLPPANVTRVTRVRAPPGSATLITFGAPADGSGHRRPPTSSSRTFSEPISTSPARSRRMTASAIARRPIASAPIAEAAIASGAMAVGPRT